MDDDRLDEHGAQRLSRGRAAPERQGAYRGGLFIDGRALRPAAGTWTTTGSMSRARARHTLTLLPSGKVLVAGDSASATSSTAELYDPRPGHGRRPAR